MADMLESQRRLGHIVSPKNLETGLLPTPSGRSATSRFPTTRSPRLRMLFSKVQLSARLLSLLNTEIYSARKSHDQADRLCER